MSQGYSKGLLADLLFKKDNYDAKLDDIFKKSENKIVEKKVVENRNKVEDEDKDEDNEDDEVEDKDEEEEDEEENEGESTSEGDRQVNQDLKPKVEAKKQKVFNPGKDDLQVQKRTIFVGNVDVEVLEKPAKKKFIKLFAECGPIESVRFRSLALEKQMNRKAAYLNKQLNSKRDFMNAYIIFKEEPSVEKSLELNATVFMNKHLRVDRVIDENKDFPTKRSVFVGNLNFEIGDEPLWTHFAECGKVEAIRVIRDSNSGLGKGFAYVLFEDPTAVQFALKLNDSWLNNRKIRVTSCKKSDRKVKKRRLKDIIDAPQVVIEGERAQKEKGRIKKPKKNLQGKLRAKNWKQNHKK